MILPIRVAAGPSNGDYTKPYTTNDVESDKMNNKRAFNGKKHGKMLLIFYVEIHKNLKQAAYGEPEGNYRLCSALSHMELSPGLMFGQT